MKKILSMKYRYSSVIIKHTIIEGIAQDSKVIAQTTRKIILPVRTLLMKILKKHLKMLNLVIIISGHSIHGSTRSPVTLIFLDAST